MSTNRQFMLKRSSFILCASIFLTGCCCWQGRPKVVVVPEAVFRTETSVTNRIKLPLDGSGQTSVTEFLAHGGSRSNRSGTPDPSVVPAAQPLITFLSSQVLRLDDLKAGGYPVLTSYFGRTYSRQVVDARNYDPRHRIDTQGEPEYVPYPVAYHHARFWWLFYPDTDGNISGLMIVSDTAKAEPKD
jgi:hypothetical protein